MAQPAGFPRGCPPVRRSRRRAGPPFGKAGSRVGSLGAGCTRVPRSVIRVRLRRQRGCCYGKIVAFLATALKPTVGSSISNFPNSVRSLLEV